MSNPKELEKIHRIIAENSKKRGILYKGVCRTKGCINEGKFGYYKGGICSACNNMIDEREWHRDYIHKEQKQPWKKK
jgi:hypothetical protein